MPPLLATLICLPFVGYLFWTERRRSATEPISWVPFCWMFIAGSRFVSTWLDMRAPGGVNAYSEGSPVDRTVFSFLIVCGCIVLSRRRLNWREIVGNNKSIALYFIYCLSSVAWTADPFVLIKRWLKDLGNPVMALILLTEPRPFDAVTTTIRRLSFLFLPLSVLFIKYYPALGRGYAPGGAPMYSGVGDQKNALGLICLTTGICYVWTMFYRRETLRAWPKWPQLVMLFSLLWLLYMANSQTSTACLAVAVGIIMLSVRPLIARQPTRLMNVVLLIAAIYAAADPILGLKERAITLLGRDTSLTNRTVIWDILGRIYTNPYVGVGFMSFWSGERLKLVSTTLGAELNQAHNGYIEQYLNLGYIGVAFVVAIILLSLFDIRRQFGTNYSVALLRLCFVVVAILYNYTEASFYGINNMWVLFLAASIQPPEPPLGATTADRRLLTTAGGRAGSALTNQIAVGVRAHSGLAVRPAWRTHPEASSCANRGARIR
jgi:exopolysaccharide production protein ExoQ